MIKPICLCCSARNINAARHHVPNLDLTSKAALKEVLHYSDDPEDEVCPLCGNNLHPYPFLPTTCPKAHCKRMIFTEGEIHSSCSKCGGDYMSNKRSNVRGKDDSARSPDHVARESENAHFAYLRLIGGPFSSLFGNAKTVVDARFKMLNKRRSIWKATRRCPYSPRHLLWGPVLKMASDPNGSDGLHGSRDFIPCESRLQRMMEDGADSESLDPDSEELWANLKTTELSTKDLTTYVMKDCPYPPEMPSLTGANTTAARVCTRSTMLESMDILGEFITDHGEQFKMDVDITHLSIKSETNGIRRSFVQAERFMTEHVNKVKTSQLASCICSKE
jgi:hypothetical protein